MKFLSIIVLVIISWIGLTNFLVDTFINSATTEIIKFTTVLFILIYTILLMVLILIQIHRRL